MDIVEECITIEEKEDNTEEFIRGSDDCLFMAHTLSSFPLIVIFKALGREDCAEGHTPDYSAEVGVASFRNSEFSFEFSGLEDDWVQAGVCYEFFVGAHEAVYILDFSEESGGTYLSHSLDGGEDLHLYGTKKLHFRKEAGGEIFYFFLEIKESPYSASQDYLPIDIIYADGIPGYLHHLMGGEFYFPSSLSVDVIEDIFYSFYSDFPCRSCGWDLEEEFEHAFCEDILSISQFFKEVEDQLFYLGFQFCYFLGYGFSFSCQEFDGVIGYELVDSIMVFDEESGDSSGINFIGFSFSEGDGFVEVRDEDRVNEHDSEVVGDEEGEEVDVVVAAGFEAEDDIVSFCHFSEGRLEFLEVFEVLIEFEAGDYVAFFVEDGGIEGVEGYIDTYEGIEHDLTSIGFKGDSRPSVPSSGLMGVLGPNQLIGDMEGGGQTPLRAFSPGEMLSPCLPWPITLFKRTFSGTTVANCTPF